MEIQKSISTAAIGGLRVEIKGKASHFFQYEEGIDAMYAASRLVVAVREINDTFLGEHPLIYFSEFPSHASPDSQNEKSEYRQDTDFPKLRDQA